MRLFKRLLFSRRATDRADRAQGLMALGALLSGVAGMHAISVFFVILFAFFWGVEIVCQAIETRPATVIVRREHENDT